MAKDFDTEKKNGEGYIPPQGIPDDLRAFLVSGDGKLDIIKLAQMIAQPDGENKHIMSEVKAHWVWDLINMDVDDWYANPDDFRTYQEVIRDSLTKWMRAVNREAVKDLHKLVASIKEKENDVGKGEGLFR